MFVLRELKVGKTKWTLTDPELKGSATARGLGESMWWDCFINSGGEDYWDEIAGRFITPKKESVDIHGADLEIDLFRSVSPPCPFFNEMYSAELEKFIAKEKVAVTTADAELDKAYEKFK